MAITVNHATLARQVNGEIEYIYPKTTSELVEYDSTQNIKEKIDSIGIDFEEKINAKVNKPLDEDGIINNGIDGQVLETNGDGTTSWVTRARIYIGSGDMPEGYDIKLDPDKVNTDIDKTLTIEGAAADAKATGDAIASINDDITDINNNITDNMKFKVSKPIDEDGNEYDGETGQVLETNGDGTTSWVTRAKIYIGSDELPEGYDIKLDPDKINEDTDKSLTIEGAAADAKATGDAIFSINDNISNIQSDMLNKVNKPLDGDGIVHNGEAGQVLETNGDGTTSWVSRARVYVGSGDMPEGYDIQIDPNAPAIVLDPTLTINGGIAEAKSTGDAIASTKEKITLDIETHNTDAAAHTDIRAMITDAKDYILLRDVATGDVHKVYVENGELKCDNTVVRCTGITITTMPTKTSYKVGEVFNPAGMVVTASYDNDTTKVVTDYTYSTVALLPNTNSMTITYIEGGITVTVEVAINVIVECLGINVITAPTKTTYYIGDAFAPAGMNIVAFYSDGTTKAVTNYTYPTGALTAGTNSITITYVEDGKTFTASVDNIVVIAKYTGITITTMPTKTSYTSGEVFNPAGMVVTASYNDGSEKPVTGYTYPTSALVTGATSITITYTENGITHTANVVITVKAAFDTSILKDFTYQTNADGTYTLTGWKGTLNGVASTEVLVPNNSAIIVDPSGI